MSAIQSWGKRLISAFGVVLLLVLVIDFNSRMVHLMQLRGEMQDEKERLTGLLQEEAALQRAIAYAESDEAIDAWARSQNWMAKDGDIVVVPLSDGTILPDSDTDQAVPQEYLDNWDAWVLWFSYRE